MKHYYTYDCRWLVIASADSLRVPPSSMVERFFDHGWELLLANGAGQCSINVSKGFICSMSKEFAPMSLEVRLDAVASWLIENAPYAEADRAHLDPHSPAQAYWHLGYMAALSDAIRLTRGQGAADNPDSSHARPSAAPDE
jgi:hypothetical protein